MRTDLIQRSLHAVAETARNIDTRGFEVDARARLRAELVPVVVRVMDDAVGVLGHVLDRYDRLQALENPEDSGVFNCMFDDMVADVSSSNQNQRVADISFVARWELNRKRSIVTEAEHSGDDWRLISECSSARRRVIKAASGVERVLTEVESRPSLFLDLYQTEKQRAVETRAAYYSFVAGLRATERACHDVERCIRLAGTGIARLIGRSIYEELRVEDRRLLRSLQARLCDWLRGARDQREGQRLLSEVSSCGALLMEVNRRPMLIEYDRELLEKLLRALQQPATNTVTFYKTLMTLRGRDPELDERIEARVDFVPRLWCGPAEQTLERLREQATGAG
jgi:hypothetical protein